MSSREKQTCYNFTVIEIPNRLTVEQIQEGKKVLIAPTTHPKAASTRQPSFGRGIFGWVLFIGLAIFLFQVLQKRPGGAPLATKQTAPLSHLLWPIILFFCGIAGVMIGFTMIRRRRLDSDLQAANEITMWVLTPDGLEQVGNHKRNFWRWEHFTSFAETDSLFVLRITPQSAKFLPKLLIPDSHTFEIARGLLVEKIVKPTPQQA